jgi:hypothetical protein
MLEKSKQKFGGYVSILYVHAKFREKLSFFVSYVKTPDIQIIGFPWNDFLDTYAIEMYTSIFYSNFFNVSNFV